MGTASPILVWVGVWGAVLSSVLALIQFGTWRLNRPRISVQCTFEVATGIDPEGGDEAILGTPVKVRQGPDVLDKTYFLRMQVSNSGDKGVQISSVTLESLEESRVNVHEVVPSLLPTVLEPRTAITLTVQKEFLDSVSAVTFFGVTDALGKRYGANDVSIREVVQQSWQLPSEVKWFKRRDDPAVQVQAFPAKQRSRLSSTVSPKRLKPRRVIVKREPPQPPKPADLPPSA